MYFKKSSRIPNSKLQNSTKVPLPALSSSNILLPTASHCTVILARQHLARFNNVTVIFF